MTMAATISRQKVVHQLFTVMGKNVKTKPVDPRPVLEQFLYAILRENATRESADQAFKILQDTFFDWNELRVSSTLEIVETLDGLVSDPETRAQRIIDFLQEVFETTYSFDLEPLLEVLQKKGVKLAAKQLARYQAASDYTVSWVMQQSLGGHAIPLDAAGIRALKRLGMNEDGDLDALKASLEHQVPKAKASQFVDVLSVLTDAHCHEDLPACARCPMRPGCPTGQSAKPAASTKKPR